MIRAHRTPRGCGHKLRKLVPRQAARSRAHCARRKWAAPCCWRQGRLATTPHAIQTPYQLPGARRQLKHPRGLSRLSLDPAPAGARPPPPRRAAEAALCAGPTASAPAPRDHPPASIGPMSGRSELLAWINSTLGLRLTKVEEVRGARGARGPACVRSGGRGAWRPGCRCARGGRRASALCSRAHAARPTRARPPPPPPAPRRPRPARWRAR